MSISDCLSWKQALMHCYVALTCLFCFSARYQELCRPLGNQTSLNECRILLNLCDNGVCIDTPDGYRCDCNQGFKPDSSNQKCLGKLLKCHTDYNNWDLNYNI